MNSNFNYKILQVGWERRKCRGLDKEPPFVKLKIYNGQISDFLDGGGGVGGWWGWGGGGLGFLKVGKIDFLSIPKSL